MQKRRVIVIFPCTDQMAYVEDFRARWDPLAYSVPAHITLVYPFESTVEDSKLEEIVGDVAHRHIPFAVELADPTVSEGEYLFLIPRRGRAQIDQLHRDLYRALPGAVLRVPFVAHMTIGRNPAPAEVQRAWHDAISRRIEVHGRAATVSMYTVHADGSRTVAFTTPIGPGIV